MQQHDNRYAQRRRFLNEWLNTASSSGLHDEIASLRQLLREKAHHANGDLLMLLWSIRTCRELLTFSLPGSPGDDLMKQGWRISVHFPDDILHEALLRSRSSGRRDHLATFRDGELLQQHWRHGGPGGVPPDSTTTKDSFAAEDGFLRRKLSGHVEKKICWRRGFPCERFISPGHASLFKMGARHSDLWHPTMPHPYLQEINMFSNFSLSEVHPSETTIGTTLTSSGKKIIPVCSGSKKSREARMSLRKKQQKR
ncbi:hypothetical protein ACLBOM_37550 [Escherichia coli]